MTAQRRLVEAHSEIGNESIRFERLPTNTTTRAHEVHRWFNFIAGFSPEFVSACLSMAGANEDNSLTLLDPFVGCGTATVTARRFVRHAVGFDPHPFFARISEAKSNFEKYSGQLDEVDAAIRAGYSSTMTLDEGLSPSAVKFLSKMFEPEDLQRLLGARQVLARKGLDENPLAFLVLSRVLDHCCFAATDGIYKAPTSRKRSVPPEEALQLVLSLIRSDIGKVLHEGTGASIYCQSSEDMGQLHSNSVDLVVTSPPYLNNFDFAEMTRMYLYFWGIAHSWGQITDLVRSKMIVNTTTALKGHRDKQGTYRNSTCDEIHSEMDVVVSALREKRTEKAGKKEYDLLIYPYMAQMQRVLGECLRTMKAQASLHMMVSDAAFYGVHIPAPRWIAEVMETLGFEDVQCEMIRPRGHRWKLNKREGAAEGLGEYYVFGRAP